jgi:hypothetical protein
MACQTDLNIVSCPSLRALSWLILAQKIIMVLQAHILEVNNSVAGLYESVKQYCLFDEHGFNRCIKFDCRSSLLAGMGA